MPHTSIRPIRPLFLPLIRLIIPNIIPIRTQNRPIRAIRPSNIPIRPRTKIQKDRWIQGPMDKSTKGKGTKRQIDKGTKGQNEQKGQK